MKEHTNFTLNEDIENLENFVAFLDKNLKCPYGFYSLDDCVRDLIRQHDVSGSTSYELSPYETESGNPESFSYDVEYHFFLFGEDGQEDIEVDPSASDSDYATTKYIF